MPFYEYQCKHCGFADTLLESMSAAASKKCPQCKKPRAFVRLISAAGFQLKGQGWYQTDFKNSGKPKEKSAAKDSNDGKAGDAANKDGDSSSDAKKPDTKKDTSAKPKEKPTT